MKLSQNERLEFQATERFWNMPHTYTVDFKENGSAIASSSERVPRWKYTNPQDWLKLTMTFMFNVNQLQHIHWIARRTIVMIIMFSRHIYRLTTILVISGIFEMVQYPSQQHFSLRHGSTVQYRTGTIWPASVIVSGWLQKLRVIFNSKQ